jgi:predicted O-methyltransferase YrrM
VTTTREHDEVTAAADHAAALATLRADLMAHVEWKVAEAQQATVKELASLDYLTRTLEPAAWIPPAGGWAASYEIIATLVARVLGSEQPVRYLEVGSGVSTIWVGLAMKKAGRGSITTFEHDLDFRRRVEELVRVHGIGDIVEVVHAPLVDQPDPELPRWYDLDDWEPSGPFDILFVDGPPGTTGAGARYAAYPRLADHLSDPALVVLDDVHRSDEAAIVHRWQDLDIANRELVFDQRVGRSALLEHRTPHETEDSSS